MLQNFMKEIQINLKYFSSLIVLFETQKNIINMQRIFRGIKPEYTFYFYWEPET